MQIANALGAPSLAKVQSEVSIFDVAEWLWAFRWLMLGCAVAAVIWAAVASQNTGQAAPAYEIKLQIFSGGTPVRPPGEIADILVVGLSGLGLELVSAPSTNPVIFRTGDRQLADGVEAEVITLTKAMIAETSARERELERLLKSNENALPEYLSSKAFLESVDSGLVQLIVTRVEPAAGGARSKMQAIVIPILACGCLFLLVAGAVTFVGEWRKWRLER